MEPLASVARKTIIQMITNGRKKVTRNASSIGDEDMAAAAEIKVGKKRGNSKGPSLTKLQPSNKRLSLGKILAPP